ncbi:MAG: uracil-DNA glycosylase [Candidatus Aenigmarchaeota archaeon]|nr:uracil-DNA glycosylase [Candidatus Aenigmarchaeota archaeon]
MVCEYFNICPLRRFEKQGKLSDKWKKKFCGTIKNWAKCIRYKEAKKGIPHPDNKLPDGKIDNNLK